MKLLTIFILGLMAITQTAVAGDKIGNGGGLWACENTQQQITAGMMVDLFEAQTEFGLTLAPMPMALAQQIAIQKAQILNGVNTVMTDKLNKYLNDVFSKVQFVNAVLVLVDDALFKIEPLPSTCPLGQWKYRQFANFTPQGQVLIRNDIWTSSVVTELDKAALLVHEAVYAWMRAEYSDTNSVRSRQIVGLLFSNLAVTEMNQRIQALLGPSSDPGILDTWACMITDTKLSKNFLGFGKTQTEAQSSSAQICGQITDAFFCNKNTAICEQAQSNALSWFCSVTDPRTSKDFSGKGRTRVEASYQALKSCEESSGDGFFCHNPTCAQN